MFFLFLYVSHLKSQAQLQEAKSCLYFHAPDSRRIYEEIDKLVTSHSGHLEKGLDNGTAI